MTIRKWLEGCIEVDNLTYPANMSLQQLLSLAEEAQNLNKQYGKELVSRQLCLFHIDALCCYDHFPSTLRNKLMVLKIGTYYDQHSIDTLYRIYRYSEHFFASEIHNLLPLYNEEKIQLKNREQNVVKQTRQEKKQEQERILLYN